MEATSKFPYAHQPLRSISFPTRVHPSSQSTESLLNHFKPRYPQPVSSTICLEAEAIQNDLVVLSGLYNNLEELFNSTQSKQALIRFQDGKLVEEALCNSVTLLETCEVSRDLLLSLKEQTQTLQSAIRRRRTDSSIERSVSSYENCRKKVKKVIVKHLERLKRMQNKVCSFSQLGQDQQQEVTFLARVIKVTSSITISILCSLLLFLSMPTTKGSSLISKLNPMTFFSSQNEQKKTNGVADFNIALCSLIGREKIRDYYDCDSQRLLRVLETLNVNVDGLESGLDCIFRCLVKNRVTFLNMLAH